jgi:hypothetical protein
MSTTDIITVGDPLPRLASVEPANGPTTISVVWASGARAGQTDLIDLAPMIYTFKAFRPLRDDPALFRTVRLGEWGASIVWEGNEDLDIGVDALEELAEETMTNLDFVAFMKRNKLTLEATAVHLGISRRLVAYYSKEREIPRYIALACHYIDVMRNPEDQAGVAQEVYPQGSFSRAASEALEMESGRTRSLGELAGRSGLMRSDKSFGSDYGSRGSRAFGRMGKSDPPPVSHKENK